MEYIMIEKEKIDGKEVYHRCSTKREENEGSKQYRYYICDNCKEHPSNSTYLGISTQDYIINRQRENKHIFCTDKEYQKKKFNEQIINKTRWASDDPIKKVIEHSDTYIAILEKDIEDLKQIIKDLKIGMEHDQRKNPIKSECESKHQYAFRVQGEAVVRCQECYKCLNDEQYFTSLEEENKTLKFQLQELHQANVNLFNESEKLKKEIKDKTKYVYKNVETKTLGSISKETTTVLSYDEHLQEQQLKINELEKELKLHKEQQGFNFTSLNDSVNRIIELKELVEIKEIINQDLTKKYEQLEQVHNDYIERLSNLTVHTNELEDKYKELQGKYNSLQEYAKNSSNNLFKVNLQHRVKPYLSEGVINVIVESNKEFK